MIGDLNERSRTIFMHIVDRYLETGTPVGSRTISRVQGMNLSSASIRNVMQDLEEVGLLGAPHTSAGRQPTQAGLRLYVDGLMQTGAIEQDEKTRIKAACAARGERLEAVYERASDLLSGLSSCASVVFAPKLDQALRQIQFVNVAPGRVLVILITEGGMVENRLMEMGHILGHDPSQETLQRASNYLTERLKGRTLSQGRTEILEEIEGHKAELDALSSSLVREGLALPGSGAQKGHLIIRGQSKLLDNLKAVQDLERARRLFDALEEETSMLELLERARDAEGIQVYIGTENRMFDSDGWSTILSPYRDAGDNVVGVIGVIGPMRLNYGRIVPIVDYTSKVMGRLLDASTKGETEPSNPAIPSPA